MDSRAVASATAAIVVGDYDIELTFRNTPRSPALVATFLKPDVRFVQSVSILEFLSARPETLTTRIQATTFAESST